MNEHLQKIQDELAYFAKDNLDYSQIEIEALLQGVAVGFYGGTAKANFQTEAKAQKAWDVGFAVGYKIQAKTKQGNQ